MEIAGTTRETAAMRWRVGFAVSAVVAFVLGIVGFALYLPDNLPNQGRGPADLAYYSLQLFVLGSDPLQQGGPYNLPLEIARFLAPATTVFAVIETLRLLFREQLRRLRAARSTGHSVVVGPGPAAVLLAKELRKTEQRVVLVGSGMHQDPARRNGMLVVSGDPSEPATLRAAGVGKAADLYSCVPDSATNAAVVLAARRLSQAANGSLAAFAQVRDGELCSALRARRIGMQHDGGFRLDFFALDDIAARALLDEQPIGTDPSGRPSALIIGFGGFGRAVLDEIGRRHVEGTDRIRVTVVDTDPPPVVETFVQQHPLVGRGCDVTVQAAPPGEPAGTTYVCLDDSDAVLAMALGRVRTQSGHVVACLPQESAFRETLTGGIGARLFDDVYGRLRVFGILDEACRPERLRGSLVDQLARAIHTRYIESCRDRGDTRETNESMAPWSELTPDLRHANIAQAEQLGEKLAAINSVVVPAIDHADGFVFEQGEVEMLARMEHQRWMDERIAQGMVYGPVREGNKHPDLLDWERLSDESRDKDLDTVAFLPTLLARSGFNMMRVDAPGVQRADPSSTSS